MKRLKLAFALCAAMLLGSQAMAASVDGLAIHSTVKGDGPTIIFVHGWTCDESSWESQVDAFAQDYRVVTLDLPGHGQSDVPEKAEDFSVDLFAAAVEAVRAELGAEKVVLVGHSMGAGVIRKYALNYPEHVAGLVAVDRPLDVRAWMLPERRRAGPMTRERRAAAIEAMFVDGTSRPLREHIRNMMMAAPDVTAQGGQNAMAAPENQSDKLITAPALTVWADPPMSDFGFDAHDMVTDLEEVGIPGTGHFLMMEQPEKFNAILREFIEQRAEY
jgi:pimeloyl-ACP methyl ester carboxylesterase